MMAKVKRNNTEVVELKECAPYPIYRSPTGATI